MHIEQEVLPLRHPHLDAHRKCMVVDPLLASYASCDLTQRSLFMMFYAPRA
jgi:hypothetical protein